MLLVGGTDALVGAMDGLNVTFVAQVSLPDDCVVAVNGLLRLPGGATRNGYTLSGSTLTLGEAPVPGDTVTVYVPQTVSYGSQWSVSPGGPRTEVGIAYALVPSGTGSLREPTAASGAAVALAPTIGGQPPQTPSGSAQLSETF